MGDPRRPDLTPSPLPRPRVAGKPGSYNRAAPVAAIPPL